MDDVDQTPGTDGSGQPGRLSWHRFLLQRPLSVPPYSHHFVSGLLTLEYKDYFMTLTTALVRFSPFESF